MADQIEVDLIIQAISKGFDQVSKQMGTVGTAAKKVDQDLKKAGEGANKSSQQLKGLGRELLAVAGISVSVAGAVTVLKTAWDFTKQGADLIRVQGQFENLAASIGSNAERMQAALEAASGGMVSNAELTAGAAQIISLGLADTEEGVVRLSTVVNKLGWDMSQVVLTFANNSKMRLDALGLSVTDVESRMEALKAAGMNADQAFDMAVIEAGEDKLRLLGDAAETTAGQIQMLQVEYKNLLDAVKVDLAGRAAPWISALSGQNANQVRQWADAVTDGTRSVQEMGDAFKWLNENQTNLDFLTAGMIPAIEQSQVKVAAAIAKTVDSLGEFKTALGTDNMSARQLQNLIDDLGMSLEEFYDFQQQILEGEQADQLFAKYRPEAEDAAEAIEDVTEELEKYQEQLDKIEQDKLLDSLEVTDETFARLVVQLGSVAAAYDYLAKVQADVAQGGGAYEVSADQVSAANEEMEQSAQEAADAARELAEQIAGIGQGAARANFDVLEDLAAARADLAAASGVWVQGEKDNSERIREIQEALASDLTDEQRKQYNERLDNINEFSREARNRWEALEADLSDSERRALIAEMQDLQAEQGTPISLFTGNFADMEEAQEQIAELEAALRENLVDAMLEAQEATAGFGEGTIDFRLALGLIDEETADAERAMLRVSQAVADLGAAVGSGAVSEETAAALFNGLLEAASGTEVELQTIMDRIYTVISGGGATASDPRQTGENLKNKMLAEVEGLPAELAEEGAGAGAALKEAMLPGIEELEERIGGLAGVAAANPVNIDSNALSVAGDIETLKATLLGLDGLTVTTTVNTVGGGGAGGGGTAGGGAEVFAAGGADFFVPPGFPNDSFNANMHLTSGERVTVTPPGQSMGGVGVTNVTANVFASSILNNPHALAGRVSQSLSNMGNRGR